MGTLVALVAFAPAVWFAQGVASATKQRLLLADARGTVWNGSAMAMLSGGAESRSAALLPGRISWSIGLRGLGLELRLRQDCCMPINWCCWCALASASGAAVAGWSQPARRMARRLAGRAGRPVEYPATRRHVAPVQPGLSLDMAAGRWRVSGQAELELGDIGSRLSQLDRLGSYVLRVDAQTARKARA